MSKIKLGGDYILKRNVSNGLLGQRVVVVKTSKAHCDVELRDSVPGAFAKGARLVVLPGDLEPAPVPLPAAAQMLATPNFTVQAASLDVVLERLNALSRAADIESAHVEADRLLCDALMLLSSKRKDAEVVHKIIDTFMLMEKWYA